MLGQRYVGLLACAALPLLGGCVQATRHSNTMVFGTNTTVGVKVGRDVHQMPNVLIAYDRQEAVIMPLLANTGEKDDRWNMLSPCPSVTVPDEAKAAETVAELTSGNGFAHPCKFVGIRQGDGGLVIQDSYSVLASFGANLKGSAKGDDATAGLAQYFATGVAAQTLAMTGGAAIVSVGEGTKEAAKNSAGPAAAAAALGSPLDLGLNTEQRATIIATNNEYDTFKKEMIGIFSRTPAGAWATRLSDFTTKSGVTLACSDSAACVRLFETGTPLFGDFYDPEVRAKLAAQKSAWQTAIGG